MPLIIIKFARGEKYELKVRDCGFRCGYTRVKILLRYRTVSISVNFWGPQVASLSRRCINFYNFDDFVVIFTLNIVLINIAIR